jgi:hypothetical protein
MISKPEYNFLYVAITRTGSEAMRGYLRTSGLGVNVPKNDHVTRNKVSWLHSGHYSALEWKTVLGEEDFNNRFKFTIVRSPWCKLVSHYTAACKYKQFGLLKSDRGSPERFNRWVKEVLTEHWVAPCYTLKYGPRAKDCDHERTPHWNCLDWITDDDGNIMVDFIGRHENHAEDYKKILGMIEQKSGIPIPIPPVRTTNTSNIGRGYQWYYNDESIELIRKYYKKDIEEFGYEY